jgi:phage terminase small subunit
MAKIKALTKKEKSFVEAYCGVAKFNGADAAREVGYSEKTARSIASKLLTKVNIQEYIQEFMNKATDKALVTTADIVKRLWEEGNDFDDGTTQPGRVSALKALTDYTGGFDANKQKVDHTSSDGSAGLSNLNITVTKPDAD